MESAKRDRPESDEPEPKKLKHSDAPPSPPPEIDRRVVLNPADCDVDFDIEGNGLQGSALYEEGFAYCWSGARANVGIRGGKYCFSCQIISAQPVNMDDTPLDQQHVCRLGISRGYDKVGNLGETQNSFGFGGTGKFSHAGKFSAYGETFGVGDTVICAVDLENKQNASISFAKNGKWLGVATHFDAGPSGLRVVDSSVKELPWESAVFPHVLLKNVIVKCQFSCEDGLVPVEGYKPWVSTIEDGYAVMGPTFPDVRDCELMMMVGLPASGKTTWAEKWVNEHPQKRYVLLGTNLALDQMKVPGLLRKQNYSERFDRLMERATRIFNTLLTRASKTPRNFIIDQTNVYKSARKRKLKPFMNYQKIAVVCFPKPEVLRMRGKKRFREMGKEVPADAVNEMIGNFVLPKSKDMPGTDEYFDQVIFIELDRAESQRYLNEMKASLSSKSSPSPYSHESSAQYYNTSMQYPRQSLGLPHHGCSAQLPGGSSVQSHSSMPVQYSHQMPIQTSNNPALHYQQARESLGPPHHGSSAQLPEGSSIESYSSTLVQYSHHMPIQTYNNPALHYQQAPSVGHRQSSYPSRPVLNVSYGNDSYTGGFPRSDDYTHHRSYSPYDKTSYSGYDLPMRSDIQTRLSAPPTVSDPYQRNVAYGMGDNLYSSNSSSMNFIPGSANNYQTGVREPYTRTPYDYNIRGTTALPGGSQVDVHTTWQPSQLPASSIPYDSPYASPNPRPPYETPNPWPYGTPNPRPSYETPDSQLPYGNYPSGALNLGGYAPPRSGY